MKPTTFQGTNISPYTPFKGSWEMPVRRWFFSGGICDRQAPKPKAFLNAKGSSRNRGAKMDAYKRAPTAPTYFICNPRENPIEIKGHL